MLQISALRYNWDIVHYIIDLLSKGPRIKDTQWTEVFGVRVDIFWAPKYSSSLYVYYSSKNLQHI